MINKETVSVEDVTDGITWIFPNGRGANTCRGTSNLIDYNDNPYRFREKEVRK